MPNSIIAEGKTTNEAIENGLKELKVTKNQVNIKVLENEDKRSFFSILAPRIVKVELTLKDDYQKENVEEIANNKSTQPKEYKKCSEEDLEKARSRVEAFLEVFSKKIGEDVKYDIEKTETGLNVNIIGNDATFLIGYRGDTLYAIQNILFAVANKGISNKVRIILDIGGYKQKREKSLELLADKIERTVIKTRKSVTLEPMKPYERKIIHSRLQNSKKVTTNSIGEEPKRRIVVSLK